MKTHKAWRTWLVILTMIVVGMVISMNVQKFYLSLGVAFVSALLVGTVLELVLPPRHSTDRVAGSLVGCISGFLLGRMIGAELLWPSAVLGAALLLNLLPSAPPKQAELPRLPGLPA